MHYKVTKFVGSSAFNAGWEVLEDKNLVELVGENEKIQVKIENKMVSISITGEGVVKIVRAGKVARLGDKSRGEVKIGDKIWLLEAQAQEEFLGGKKNNFEGAAVVIDFSDEEIIKKQAIYVNEKSFFQEKNNRSVNIILGGVVFILLIVGTLVGYQKKSAAEQKEKFNSIKNVVEAKMTEIESVRSVNMETALQLAKDAEAMVNNTGSVEKNYPNEIANLKKQIADIKKTLGGESIDYEVAYDTSLIKEGNEFRAMAVKDSLIYLWGSNLGQINQVNVDLRSTEKIIADERIKSWFGVINNGEKWIGYNQNKVFEIKRNELIESEIKGLLSTGEMAGWGGVNYVIDNNSQNIIKLNSSGEGKAWLKEGTNLSEEATSISIDSNIWILGKSGKIYKYNRGVNEKFDMSSFPSLNSARNLRTSDKVDFLAYIADENTVVICGKDGKISRKYNFGKVKINDIGVENQNKAILVLAENGKIYRVKN